LIATIDTPLNGNELFVDNIIYQFEVSSVPAPAAIWLFGSGLIGFIGARKNQRRSVNHHSTSSAFSLSEFLKGVRKFLSKSCQVFFLTFYKG